MDNPKSRLSKNKKLKFLQNVKRSYFIITSILVLIVLFIVFNLFNNFNKTSEWKKDTSAPIAQVEPYTLYLTDEDKLLIQEYNSLYVKLYDSQKGDLQPTATEELLNQFNEYYSKMSDTLKEREFNNYQRVNEYFNIKESYDKLFNNGTVVATTQEVQKYIKDYGNLIKRHLENPKDTSEKSLLKSIYSSLQKLSEDSTMLFSMYTMFNETFNISKNEVTIKKDTTSENLVNWYNFKNKLNYNWEFVNTFMNDVVNKSTEILKNHDKILEEYNLYIQRKTEQADYKKWLSQFEDLKKDLIPNKSFVGQPLSELNKWAEENNITVNVTYTESTRQPNTVLTQNNTNFKSILKGSFISVTVAQEKQTETTTTSTTEVSSSEEKN